MNDSSSSGPVGGHHAHSLPGCPVEEWQSLPDHLSQVGELAASFAEPFGGQEWARLAGSWHDLGKYSAAFQQYLRGVSSPDPHVADGASRTDHSTAGAQHAAERIEVLGHLLAYAISGHHSGLLDGRSDGACLEDRLGKNIEPWGAAPKAILDQQTPELPGFIKEAFGSKDEFSIAFFVRMLFSCLVDADFLDTERFMSPERATQRPGWPSDILQQMDTVLTAHVEQLAADDTVVNQERTRVRDACLKAAAMPPGLFSLTVPTGGGKTLSSLAFALRHAIRYGLRRVVYVIPFTSIIEQNAIVFRGAMVPLEDLGIEDPVVEHHSNLDVARETTASGLATENWDAPLVVTTSVQFYESLFANKTSRCRKLHNLSSAVIILDEVQTIPVDYLEPCLRALRELANNYGSTVVLCTATQPAVHRREKFPIGLDGVVEIIPDPPRLYRSLKRVEVEDLGPLDDAALVERIRQHERVLCIVNTRSHAREVFESLGNGEGIIHLSALMCPEHRSEVLARIKQRLREGRACQVISTQLIEAGVDIDFPCVYRSLSGLDSIAQAAGRCNRNGELSGPGQTFVFRSEHRRSEQFLTETANCASQVLPLHEDPLSLAAVEHYFRLYYWEQSSRWDAKDLLAEFNLNQDRDFPFLFGFSTVGRRFRLIEDTGRPVIIPYGTSGTALCKELRQIWTFPSRELLRGLQRYTVQVPRRVWEEHAGRTIELVLDTYPVLMSMDPYYSDSTGLCLDRNSEAPIIA